ncbi:alpha/beta fold hydrolase [Cryobacterium sp. TMT1-21]|uniref:Alpha/beta fold hydrolase n=1 Tax=Cryobacterium shii TaxID=1259235 RepID=A0AAQ2C601_9MICO|nr:MULTISPECIES: alpha/beta hydrolase [Cryobacterium]TFC46402.1 alpha/beta fold hydrolase [Cryobacterium shii]TFD17324.1 alpha/beta fold hydrolase [Cryobacterium sp. TMT1-21]TFD20344.1 alpha/beta fold hydrolase [Cryobacterium sp. TMT2-23]TFD22351.1 alpha/beta fold hydrolase [Cryobacterium sp. TMT4-10]TFD39973.1 alpha/beta fold hydrolase [Cryobacterium sp. TMT2-10]
MTWWADLTERLRSRRPPLLHVATDEGSGPVVILVHGIASSSETFREVVPLLVRSHRVIALDILGFGKSPAPDGCEYRLEDHVDALAATIRSLKLREPFMLVGHSLGSLIVARFAALPRTRSSRRTRVSRVVLVGPPVYLSPAEIGDRWVRARVSAYLRAYDFLRLNKEFTLANAAIITRLLPRGIFELTERNWTPFVKSLENCIENQTLVSDIASLQLPVDVVYGTLDAFLAAGSMTVIERMRHVTMHRVDANDHLIRPRLARALVGVIDQSEPAAPAASVRSPGPGD